MLLTGSKDILPDNYCSVEKSVNSVNKKVKQKGLSQIYLPVRQVKNKFVHFLLVIQLPILVPNVCNMFQIYLNIISRRQILILNMSKSFCSVTRTLQYYPQ